VWNKLEMLEASLLCLSLLPKLWNNLKSKFVDAHALEFLDKVL
jgi:hypothetical protein